MRNRFQSLPVDNDVYKLIAQEAAKSGSTRTEVMNRILRSHFGLVLQEVAPKKFNPVVNLRSRTARTEDIEELETFANKLLREAAKLK